MATSFDSDVSPEGSTRPVTRVEKIQAVHFGLDSLYVVLEYPRLDTFLRWSPIAAGASLRELQTGIPVDEFVVRKGGNGYTLSVWEGDARLYVTERVDEALQGTSMAGQGMGVLLQLGPKWLRQFGDIAEIDNLPENVFTQLSKFGVASPTSYPARLNRVDLTLDVLGLDVGTFSVDEWATGWVGYARKKTSHFSSTTGRLETINIGTPEGGISFKVYDKVAESTKKGTLRFWRSVWGLPEEEPISVSRFEWSVQAYKARFAALRYLQDLDLMMLKQLVLYVSEIWGELRIPDENDSNRSRWQPAPLWLAIIGLLSQITWDAEGRLRRQYDFRQEITPHYLKSAAGWFGGLLARLGVDRDFDAPSTIGDAFDVLANEGLSVHDKAKEKYEVLSRLSGKGGQQ